ncbi:SGNH/GDSL hydrolase family protein [Hymenobacter sp. DG25B]|uniref:SGNH/GDSL hydrolase family protein n=1 Tax=Hymenobacter sp. DG25B TaxID=1385664 RepID=UPI0006626767|nr:SGNH/GDSL hydrolase family protein [Hymenobacter sp. DG25B]
MITLFKKSMPGLALLGLVLGGCQPELEAPKADKGSADFSKYVAVGNSLTAGYSDGGLYLEGQQNSYPNILAQQFKLVGGGEFKQPLFAAAQSNGSGYLRFAGFTSAGSPNLQPVTTNLAVRGLSPAGTALYTKFTDPVQNLAVPGIAVADVNTVGYGSVAGNPYFERLLPGEAGDPATFMTYTSFVQSRVTAEKPTFFTLWLGNNDVLGFATAGGASGATTDPEVFATNYAGILDALTSGGAKGAVATIPNVTALPFFTTVGPSVRANLTKLSVPGMVILTGAKPGGATSGNRKQIATADIRDASGNGRQLFTLTSSAYAPLLGAPTGKYWRDLAASRKLPVAALLATFELDTTQAFGVSAGNPFPSALILDDAEQATVQKATTDLNLKIRAAAAAKGIPVADMNAFFVSVAGNGIAVNAVNNTVAYISGNLFSLDGVHPTPRGYAAIANEFIQAINTAYNASVPKVNPNDYRGVTFP